MTTITKDIISGLSLTELKQLLSRVNQDITSIKRAERRAKNIKALTAESEYITCNNIAAKFTGKQYDKPIENARIIADIQIQKDILEFINNGGRIITRKSRKSIKPFTVSSKVVSL
jgi:hypothetical protein